MKKSIFFMLLCLLVMVGYTQPRCYLGQYISVGGAYQEMQDAYYRGLVFRGADVQLAYGLQSISPRRYIQLGVGMAAGSKTALDTWGYRWQFTPMQGHFSWNVVPSDGFDLYIGPAFQANYQLHTYTDLGAGSNIWMANYDVGVLLSGFFTVADKLIEIGLRTNAFGWYSRPAEEIEAAYFFVNPGNSFEIMHENLRFGGADIFNHTDLLVRVYWDGRIRESALTYSVSYQGYYGRPRFEEASHRLAYTWFLD